MQSASLIGNVGRGFRGAAEFADLYPGNIFVPYTGQIPASRKTLAHVDQEIVDRIKEGAIEPLAQRHPISCFT
jgi:protein involved in polysaccharide export with SLBB domain